MESITPETTPDFALRHVRRYTQSLVVFESCLKKSKVKIARRTLKPVMAMAGDVRNYDIAAGLIPGYQNRVAPLRRNARVPSPTPSKP